MTQQFTTSSVPAGWATSDPAPGYGTGGPYISFVNPGTDLTCSPTNGDAFLVNFNSYVAAAGTQSLLYQTTSFSTVGYNTITVYFDWFQDADYSGSDDQVMLEWSNDGYSTSNNTTWMPRYNSAATSNGKWYTESFVLPAGAITSTLQLTFCFYSGYGNSCHLDNIKVTGIANACTQPGSQATAASWGSNTTGSSMTASWANGSGYPAIVVVNAGTSSSAITPVSGTVYTASAVYGSGSSTGTGNYVVYAGAGTSINVTGLTSGSEYTFTTYTYNTTGDCYLLTGVSNSATATVINSYCASAGGGCSGCDGITNVTFAGINYTPGSIPASGYINETGGAPGSVAVGSSYTISEYVNTGGNYTNYQTVWIDWNQDFVFEAGEEYVLGSATNVTNGLSSSCPYSITVPGTAVAGTTRMRVNSSYYSEVTNPCDPAGWDGEVIDFNITVTPACVSPVTQASNLLFSAVTETTMTLNWTNGSGTSVLVVAQAANSSMTNPVNGTTYTGNPAFGSGTVLGAGFAVYAGAGTTVSLTGLTAGTQYYFSVYSYQGAGICYLVPGLANNTITLCAPPTTQSSALTYSSVTGTSMTLNWTRGNGTGGVLVLAGTAAESTNPVNGTAYTANAVYGGGTAVGAANVIYNGTGTTVNLSGLNAGTTYYFALYEYNTSNTCYLTSLTAGFGYQGNQATMGGSAVTIFSQNFEGAWTTLGQLGTSVSYGSTNIPDGSPVNTPSGGQIWINNSSWTPASSIQSDYLLDRSDYDWYWTTTNNACGGADPPPTGGTACGANGTNYSAIFDNFNLPAAATVTLQSPPFDLSHCSSASLTFYLANSTSNTGSLKVQFWNPASASWSAATTYGPSTGAGVGSWTLETLAAPYMVDGTMMLFTFTDGGSYPIGIDQINVAGTLITGASTSPQTFSTGGTSNTSSTFTVPADVFSLTAYLWGGGGGGGGSGVPGTLVFSQNFEGASWTPTDGVLGTAAGGGSTTIPSGVPANTPASQVWVNHDEDGIADEVFHRSDISAGWSTTDNVCGGLYPPPTAGNSAHCGANGTNHSLLFDNEDCTGAHWAYVVSPSMNLSGYSSAILTFYYANQKGNTTSSLEVDFSINGGTSWVQAGLYGKTLGNEWELITVGVPSTCVGAGATTVTMRFYVIDGGAYSIGIDEVNLYGGAAGGYVNGGGGGGGACTVATIAVTPGTVYNVTIGGGGFGGITNGSNGGTTTFSGPAGTWTAGGGNGGAGAVGTSGTYNAGGAGSTVGTGTGATVYNGGYGYKGYNGTSVTTGIAAGGGGGGGSTGAGAPAAATNAACAISGAGGTGAYPGGAGGLQIATCPATVATNVPGVPGLIPGGGGSGDWGYTGGSLPELGGNGGCGKVVITWAACVPPAAPTAVTPSSGVAICSGNSTNLNATSAGNTINWYTVATGGTKIGNSASAANYSVSPSTTTTYYAEAQAAQCVSTTRTATAAVTVTTQGVATFSYLGTPFCANVSNPLPSYIGAGVAGTYTVTPAGLNFISPSTGQVNLATSTAGVYAVTNTISATGGCAAVVVTEPITILAMPSAATVPTGPTCVFPGENGVVYTEAAIANALSYNWTYTVGTGPSNSSTGNYFNADFPSNATTGTLTVAGVNGCGTGTSSSVAITVTAASPAFSAGPDQYLCTGTTTATMAATGAQAGTWTCINTGGGAAPTITNPTSPTACTVSGLSGGSSYIYVMQWTATTGCTGAMYSNMVIVVE